MSALSLVSINKKCPNSHMAVKDFNLNIEEKEFVVLAGPAECGKSLIVRMLAGLEEPTSGEIYIDGVLVNGKEPKDRHVAMIFQNYTLYPNMNVYENIAFALKMENLPQEEVDRRVRETAETMKITQILNKRPESLDQCQELQVVVARAIVRQPKVLLMDDPLVKISDQWKDFILEKMNVLYNGLNIPFIYATQDQGRAMAMGTKIVVLNEGSVQQSGTPKELYDQPANQFVARFIGDIRMNMAAAQVEEENGKVILSFDGHKLTLDERAALALQENVGKSVYLGVRAQDICLADKQQENVIELQTELYEERENGIVIQFKVDDAMWTALDTEGKTARTGDMARLAINMNKIHIFAADTGKSII